MLWMKRARESNFLIWESCCMTLCLRCVVCIVYDSKQPWLWLNVEYSVKSVETIHVVNYYMYLLFLQIRCSSEEIPQLYKWCREWIKWSPLSRSWLSLIVKTFPDIVDGEVWAPYKTCLSYEWLKWLKFSRFFGFTNKIVKLRTSGSCCVHWVGSN
jgi:hypothetical protein